MFGSIVGFELRYQLHQRTFYAWLAASALIGYLLAVAMAGWTSALKLNAPSYIAATFSWLALLGAYMPLWVCADAALRDRDAGMTELVRTTPTPAWLYLLARVGVAYMSLFVVFLAAAVGFELGCRMWWIDATRVTPFRPLAYANAFAVLVLPTLFILGAMFVLVAAATQKRFAAYILLIIIFFLTFEGNLLSASGIYRSLAGLIDPTGLVALRETTSHWSNTERNTLLVPLHGVLLWNRVVWGAIGLCCLTLAGALLARRDSPGAVHAGAVAADPTEPVRSAYVGPVTRLGVPDPHPSATAVARRPTAPYGGAGLADQIFARLWLEARAILLSWTFAAMAALVGLMFILPEILWQFAAPTLGELGAVPSLPVTAQVAGFAAAACDLPLLVIAIFLGGEMVWRERQAKIAELIDATPTPSFVFLITKLGALAVVMVPLLCLAIIIGVGYQLAHGMTRIDVHFYAVTLLVALMLPTMMLAVLAALVHVVVNSRFVGHLVMVGLAVGFSSLTFLEIEHPMIAFGQLPEVRLSDMNGLGHFLTGPMWFLAYWGSISVLLGVATVLLWVRGPAPPLLTRVRATRHAMTRMAAGIGLLALLGTVLTGGYVYWNTRILNLHATKAYGEQQFADYEKKYGPLLGVAQPRVVAIDIAIDLHPELRTYSMRGQYVLANVGTQPIETVFVRFRGIVDSAELADATLVDKEGCCNVYMFRPRVPLAPGETRVLSFAITFSHRGFRSKDEDKASIWYNGTFLRSGEFAPQIGLAAVFLLDERRRRAHGLVPLDQPPKASGSPYRQNFVSPDSDLVRFAVTVSTSLDQIAVAPGYLQREWIEGGRKYFRYEMDRPILNFWAIVSARYAVVRDRWNDVELAVYHHPPHVQHVRRMLDATKLALAYCSSAFGPFQFRQLRILEFPYGEFAQSFPDMVPFGEQMGFIVHPAALVAFDVVTSITAHEVAHQWWAHQVTPAAGPGANFLTETLAEYSALMVMERLRGKDRIRAFLKSNLDAYLQGRGQDAKERPLARVERGQNYIAYKKGGIAMYALKEAIGETAVNRALARLVREHAFKSDPYPRPDDLIRLLRAEAGPRHQQLITDLFEKIVLWDYGVVSVKATATEDGKWLVQLKVRAGKLEAYEGGAEKEVPLDQDVDIGLFTADPRTPGFTSADVIVLERRRLKGGTHTIELVTGQRPTFAGIKPYLTLIQRNFHATVAAVPH
jgi:hypothetical protein